MVRRRSESITVIGLLCLLCSNACTHGFGVFGDRGSGGDGGASNTVAGPSATQQGTAAPSSGSFTSAESTSIAATQSATQAVVSTSEGPIVSSSASGQVELGPCNWDGTDIDFIENFDSSANPLWMAQALPPNSDGYVFWTNGEIKLRLEQSDQVSYWFSPKLNFSECFIDTEQTNTTVHQIEIVALYLGNNQYFEHRFISTPGQVGDTEVELRWGGGAQATSTILDDTRQSHIRLATSGNQVWAAQSSDGNNWTVVFETQRRPWMNQPVNYAFRVRRGTSQAAQQDTNAGCNFDNVNTQ